VGFHIVIQVLSRERGRFTSALQQPNRLPQSKPVILRLKLHRKRKLLDVSIFLAHFSAEQAR
jgi:hypothetical protein